MGLFRANRSIRTSVVSGIALKIERNSIGEFARLPFYGIPKKFNVYLKKPAIQATIKRTKFVQMTNVGGGVGDKVDTKLTERQEGILNLIKENTHVSANEMSEILSVTQMTIERDLAAMQKKKELLSARVTLSLDAGSL